VNHQNPKAVPPVLRSREHLAAQGISFLSVGTMAPTALPITADGVTYIFAFNASPTAGPVISKAVNTPAFEGVQMITWLAPGVFASSNDESSIIVWSSPSGNWTDL